MRLNADARHAIRLEVNGRAVEAEAEPRMLLTDFLRHKLGLTGTHVGCEHGVCGACTVEIDGAPARSCITHAGSCDGASIRTIEGFGEDAVNIQSDDAHARSSFLARSKTGAGGQHDIY